ncbi:glycosyltransferase family 4 protein [Candidatus Atribacteria bacterium HGW-Atribacteria-1]|nr:MAG: glycosyltransferase family 4 protein [Candidatus Atribacteria bacterium HGW-Atribacteria-1]
MKLAIVHDYLNQYGGAERGVGALHEIFPMAPIYTSIYLSKNMPDSFKKMDIRTSFMQNLPFLNKHFKKYFMFYPFAFRNFDFSDYDIILSSSSAYAKGIKVPAGVVHICYCYTPARFIWRYKQYMEKEKISYFAKKIIYCLTFFMRKWDLNTNKSVNCFLTSCENIKRRIKNTYNRDSKVIYPPVEISELATYSDEEDYFLIVSRLNAYKRIDIAVKACNKLKLPLKIIGEGPYRNILEQMAQPNIVFLGKVTEEILAKNYNHCKAFIFPGEEDFGITPLEAQAYGKPVIAYGQGGALETVVDGVTGIFFKEQTTESLAAAIRHFEIIKDSFNPKEIRKNALKFDKEIFKAEIKALVAEKYSEFRRMGAGY